MDIRPDGAPGAGGSAHEDAFARAHLPPPEQWPVFLPMPADDPPARLNVVSELLDRHLAQGRGDRLAILEPGGACDDPGSTRHWSYAALHDLVVRIGRVLVESLGLIPGNRVLLRGANGLGMAATWLAVVRQGLIAVPTMPLLRATELQVIAQKARVEVVLCADALLAEPRCLLDPDHAAFEPGLRTVLPFSQLLERAQAIPDDAPPLAPCDTAADDVCLIAFTSGTTGHPKGTMHFHRDVLAMCDLFPSSVLGLQPDDRVCGTPPLAFTFGLGGLLCFPLRVGAATLLLERTTPQQLLAAVAAHRVTTVFTAPTFWRQMAEHAPAHDLSSLRHCVSAGEALPQSTRTAWRAASGVPLTDGLGATEMIHIFLAGTDGATPPGALGRVVAGYEARIVDEAMQPLPPGQVGRLAVRGPTGCRYLDDPRQAEYVRDGWNLPGDMFSMDASGYFFYHARADDMIVSAGYNIAGPEVEAALLLHPDVAECGVVGMPNADRGQIVKAYVVLRQGVVGDAACARGLQDWVKERIAPFKYPRAVAFLERLPRTDTGKLQRFALRKMARDISG